MTAPDLAGGREELRGEARAALGVTGRAETESWSVLRRRYDLSLYPLVALGVLYLVDGFQGYAFAVLAPNISRALGVSLGAIGAATALRTASVALSPLPIAALAQRPGRRATICLVTAFLWSATTLLTGFVTSLVALVAILVVDGLTTGSVTALHAPLVMDSYHPAARVRAMSLYYAGGFVGQVGAPLLVALFAGAVDLTWRGVFLAMGATSIVLTLACTGLKDPGAGKWDTDRIRASVHGETVTTAGRVELGFWEICRRLLLVDTLRRVYSCFVLAGVLVIPFQTYLSFFLDQRWNMSAAPRGLFFAYFAAMSGLALAFFGGRAEAAFRESPARLPRMIGSLLAVAVLFIALGGVVANFGLMLACFGLAGAAIGPLVPALFVSSLSIIPAATRPHAQALGGIFFAVGGFLGAIFFSSLAYRYGIGEAFVVLAVPGLISARVIASASRGIGRDLDHMIDAIVEEEEILRVRQEGGHLPLLACSRIDFSYGPLQVLFGVDFAVDDGEMVALLGVNGSGKSTLLKVISGLGLPSAGSVRLAGEDITYLDAERRLHLGVTQIPGGRAVFGPMTVAENLRSYAYTVRRDRARTEAAIDQCFEFFPRLAQRRNNLAASLSGGEQQMLGLSKALILRPRLLMIDELSLGLAPVVVAQLLEMVRAINAAGTAVVLVEQSVNIALGLVEHAYFMERGAIRFDGPAGELLERDDLLRAVFLHGSAAAR